MSKLRIVPMTESQYIEAAKHSPPWADVRTNAKAHMHGDCLAGLIDDRLAWVAGVMPFWSFSMPNRVGEAWAILTPLGRQHALSVHRAVIHGLRAIIAERGYHRVEAQVYRDFMAGRIWASRLGFRKRCVLKRRSPDGKDMVLYEWLR